MKVKFCKYHGTGNDFIIVDNRPDVFDAGNNLLIKQLCDRRFGIGADGLMLLNTSEKADFTMDYFNADGQPGSMCGNGGRCLVAFAKRLDIINTQTVFNAIDGIHSAFIETYKENSFNAMVRLKMNDVKTIEHGSGFAFLDTGSPHYVKFVDDISNLNVVEEGRKIRYSERFYETGINVNFINVNDNSIHIRTYERGVEDETLSCGTGAVAAALVVAEKNNLPDKNNYSLRTVGGNLTVHFEKEKNVFKNIYLEGPATFVFEGEMEI